MGLRAQLSSTEPWIGPRRCDMSATAFGAGGGAQPATGASDALIHRFLPSFAIRQVDRVPVRADVRRTWAFVRSIDLYQVGLARLLFSARLLPDVVGARLRGKP